jgi:hypothetical protein
MVPGCVRTKDVDTRQWLDYTAEIKEGCSLSLLAISEAGYSLSLVAAMPAQLSSERDSRAPSTISRKIDC